MAKYYVIQLANTEYNDETYSIEGWGAVDKHGFIDLDEAKEAAKHKLADFLTYHSMADFGDIDEDDALVNEFLEQHPDTNKVKQTWGSQTWVSWDGTYEINWNEFIDWCIMHGHDWLKHVPQLVYISEIEFPNPCKKELTEAETPW